MQMNTQARFTNVFQGIESKNMNKFSMFIFLNEFYFLNNYLLFNKYL